MSMAQSASLSFSPPRMKADVRLSTPSGVLSARGGRRQRLTFRNELAKLDACFGSGVEHEEPFEPLADTGYSN